MKSTVENLDPARIKLTVEVPYEELKPSLDAAYKEIGSQVQVPGFRRGHVPAPVIDQRVGRAAVIQEAVNKALPDFYRQAVTEAGRVPLMQPEVEITDLPNVTGPQGGQFVFNAEVTVRPLVDLPELENLSVSVSSVTVDETDVDDEVDTLRMRFGSLHPVVREVRLGDFVTLDLRAVIDDEEVDSASGVSYEVLGTDSMLKGMDAVLLDMQIDESATFTTHLAGGEHEGEEAEVTVTVTAVKERELPEVDEEFVQMASEFDTVDELREDLRRQVIERRNADQAIEARDALLEVLRQAVEVEAPAALVDEEVKHHLSAEGKDGDEEHAKEIREDVTSTVRDQIILDVLAESLEVKVNQDELIDFLVQTAQQYGMEPMKFIEGAQKAGQIPAFVAEIARNKSLAMALRHVEVKDSDGQVLDLTEFIGSDELDAAAGAHQSTPAEAAPDQPAPDEANEFTVDAEFAESAESADSAESAESAQSAESAESADSAESAESAQSAESAESADSAASAASAE